MLAERYINEFKDKEMVLGTRGSLLALWQANHIKDRLEAKGVKVRLKSIKTSGDKLLDSPLANVGGKGLFTKEIESELLSEKIDFAVHSLKDMPVIESARLSLAAVTKREDARDCLLSERYANVSELPKNAKVGTTSLRRSLQLKLMRSDLDSKGLRGNIQTRLNKLKSGEYDAIILAAAGLKRLGIESEIPHIQYFSTDEMIPAMAQGALGLQCRDPKYSPHFRDLAVCKVLESLHNKDAALSCGIERAFIALLGGGCNSPIGIHAQILKENRLKISCIVGTLDAKNVLRDSATCERGEVEYVLQSMINTLKANGVDRILAETHGG
ncbi:hydroxymethylbilane synthase [Helicobacter saguini]|uniref:Porphobilinogen deaminase n=1 Tax=Helicobacter saguini TaxID=1548018 RepID=A0A347VR45_9HELI|nr:hydroxymethylbilane synthase [Helicobacter saguini]MWV63039.1 hydroxymethylbilane synthase [Helicobacter saguini]MWV66292.1 hydroxymethylbilane synthase [Helicobacter saguini]MWV68644.1 hydroxymethylbilane synthase [Helicobacter saguini]MWV71805.1 hydroxymethylbilane synthase [Helicobacter saguini]TLD95832.1 hydroxymethylbilane synthase [Helicobacter saguini]